MALSNNGMTRMLSVLRRTRIIDQKGYDILFKEVSNPVQRFSFYACASYMRFLKLDAEKFVNMMNKHEIKGVFIFGERDRNYPPAIGQAIIPKINFARQLVINENHDMINRNFAQVLSSLLNDN